MKDAKEIAWEIMNEHTTMWAYCMEDVKCIGAPVSIARLNNAILAAIEARDAEWEKAKPFPKSAEFAVKCADKFPGDQRMIDGAWWAYRWLQLNAAPASGVPEHVIETLRFYASIKDLPFVDLKITRADGSVEHQQVATRASECLKKLGVG